MPFVQVNTCFRPCRPGFPQHDAQEGPGTDLNGPEADHSSRAIQKDADLRKPCYGRFLAMTIRWT
ncbi:hypothetical protein GCM10009731_33440 [Streptomyces globosus]